MKYLDRRGFGQLAAAGTAVLFNFPAIAQEGDEFFKGKTIKLLVGAQAGQSYDLSARLVAQYITKYIPGKPNIIVENMPGAGSLSMTNFVYNIGPFDGTLMALPLSSVLLEPSLNLLSRSGGQAKFDLMKFNWIGTPVQDPPVLLVNAKANIDSFAQLRSQPLVVGTSGAGADNNLVATLCNALLGTQLKLVSGYKGVSDMILAFERGEISGFATGYSALPVAKPQWLTEGTIKLLAQFGLERIKQQPNVPTAIELAETDDAKEMLRIYARKFNAAYPFLLPPNVPRDRVEIIRTAFNALMKDAEFIDRFNRTGMVLDPVSGAGIEKLIISSMQAPPRLVDQLRSILVQN